MIYRFIKSRLWLSAVRFLYAEKIEESRLAFEKMRKYGDLRFYEKAFEGILCMAEDDLDKAKEIFFHVMGNLETPKSVNENYTKLFCLYFYKAIEYQENDVSILEEADELIVNRSLKRWIRLPEPTYRSDFFKTSN